MLLVLNRCSTTCAGIIAIDPKTGKRLWASPVSAGGVLGTTDGHVRTGTLRLLDITTSRAETEIDVPPAQNQPVELSTTTDTVVLNFEDSPATKATIYSSTDLTELWSRDEIVYPLGSDLFYVGGGVITDQQGRRAWQTPERVHTSIGETAWGYTQTDESSDVNRTRYVELATGRQLADDLNTPAHLGRAGVLQADSFGQFGTDIGGGEPAVVVRRTALR